VEMRKVFQFPNRWTFRVKAIREFVKKWMDEGEKWVDPFVGQSVLAGKMYYTNDLNPELPADHHTEAVDFLCAIPGGTIDGVILDPPYSPTQIKRAYDGVGFHPPGRARTQMSFYSRVKDQVGRILKEKGKVLSFGWNSNGMGKTRGFVQEEILLVAHGGNRNDTICLAETRGY